MLPLVLAAQLTFAPPTADIAWASRVYQGTTIVVVTYPAPVLTLLQACLVLYDGTFSPDMREDDTYQELERHCWAPTNPTGDFNTWPHLDLGRSGHSMYGVVTFINLRGERETHYALQIGGDS